MGPTKSASYFKLSSVKPSRNFGQLLQKVSAQEMNIPAVHFCSSGVFAYEVGLQGGKTPYKLSTLLTEDREEVVTPPVKAPPMHSAWNSPSK